MKIKATVDTPATAIGVKDSGTFRIRPSAKAFKILSDGLYSNKIRAIVRELSCNAHDSHVAAGKPDLPIDVHLPNSFEPWYAVRDYGVGLNHDEVMSIYTTYFESTKSDSNDYIGALGLGSKSPFSYTDQFSVVAIKDGMKRTYCAYLNEGIPSISLMSEIETDEGNGVEVKVDIKQGDYHSFLEEVSFVYSWFKVTPKITGNTNFKVVEHPIAEINGKKVMLPCGAKLISSNSYGHHRSFHGKMIALQGNVAYPIDIPRRDMIPDNLHYLFDLGFVIPFEIGELDVLPSREGLGYDAQTLENIVAKLKVMDKELVAHIESMFDKGTIWQKFDSLNMVENSYRHFNGATKRVRDAITKKYPFNARKIVDRYYPNTKDKNNHRLNNGAADIFIDRAEMLKLFKDMNFFDGYDFSNWHENRDYEYDDKTKSRKEVQFSMWPFRVYNHYYSRSGDPNEWNDNIHFFVVDSTAHNTRIKHYFKEKQSFDKLKYRFVAVITPMDGEDFAATEKKIKKMVEDLGNPNAKIIRTSTLDKPASQEKVKKGSIVELHFSYDRDSQAKCQVGKLSDTEYKQFEQKTEVVYIPLNNTSFDCAKMGAAGFDVSHIVAMFRDFKCTDLKNLTVYGIRKSEIGIVQDNPKFTLLYDYLVKHFDVIFTKEKMTEAYGKVLYTTLNTSLFNYLDGRTNNDNVKKILDVIPKKYRQADDARWYNRNILERIIHVYETVAKTSGKATVLNLEKAKEEILMNREAVFKAYPILGHVEENKYRSDEQNKQLSDSVLDLVG